jgi:O-antigen/teichoic acid export membrane protein
VSGSPEPPEALTAAETGQRALGGAVLLLARGSVGLILGLGANILLARLLTPRDFGVVALGTVLIVFGSFLADGGLGSGLIRRREPPTRLELEAVNGLQLLVTGAIVAVAFAVAAPLGRDALVVATMVAALPILMLRVPAGIVLERRLDYRAIAWVDVAEAATFYVWAVTSVALGAGVWGFATAALARAAVGAALMLRLGPLGIVRPRWSWPAIRPLVGFGAKFQTVVVVNLVRDQALNVGIAVTAGVATLGVWSLAWRVLQIPSMVFGTVGRIGFPAMSRLLEAGEDPKPVIERGGAALAVIGGVMMVALVGFAPALPRVLGPGWEDVPAVLLWAGPTLIAAFPIAVGGATYLFARDEGGIVIGTLLYGSALWLVVALALVPAVGAPAAAVGWAAGSAVQLPPLAARVASSSGARVARRVGLPIAIGIAAALAGWLAAAAAGRTLAAGALGVLAGEAVLVLTLLVAARAAADDTRRLLAQAFASLRGPGRSRTGTDDL